VNRSANIPIHETTEAARPPKARHGPQVVSFVVDEPGAKGGILGSRDWAPSKRNANSFARNASSICCMVLSKTTDTDENKAFKALHYFGGDALWDTEAGIALWASADGTPIEIEAMKMSQ
jgi:hypothetical protein